MYGRMPRTDVSILVREVDGSMKMPQAQKLFSGGRVELKMAALRVA